MEARGRGMNRGTQTVVLMLAMVATMAVLLLWEISPFALNSNHVVVLNSPIQSFAGDLAGIHGNNENKTKASNGPERDSSSAEFGTERGTTPDEQSFITDLSRQENMTENTVRGMKTAEPDDQSATENTDKFKVIALFENEQDSNDLAESPETIFAAATEKTRSEKLGSNSTVQLDERNYTVNTVAGQGFDLEKQGNDQLEGRGKSGGGVTQLPVLENVSGFEVGKGNSSAVEGGEGGESGEEVDVELADAVSPDSSIHEATENLGLVLEDDEAAGFTAVEEKEASEKNAEGGKKATENLATENLGLVMEDDEPAGFTAVVEKAAHVKKAERQKATENLGLVFEDDEAGFTAVVEKGAREKNAEGKKATENLATENLGLVMEDDEPAGFTAVVEKAAHVKKAERQKATENLGLVFEDDEAGFTAVVEKGAREKNAEGKKATENLATENLGLVMEDDEPAGFTAVVEKAAHVKKAERQKATENLGLVFEDDEASKFTVVEEKGAHEKNAEEKKATENLGLDMEDDEAGFTAVEEKGAPEKNAEEKVCDYAVGKWVLDKTRPFYSGRECSMWLSPDWACRLRNHPDKQMDRYRWQPAGCNLPMFNASATLESLRNKVVAFVGDSLGQQQWQSLLCMLTRGKNSTPISDTASTFNFYTPRGGRRPTGWAHRFEATNTTFIFKWSVTLAKVETLNKSTNALHLDRSEQFLSDHLHNLDIVVLNSGHHWNNGKMDQNGYKFYAKGKPVTKTSVPMAYNQTIHNVVNWIHAKTRNSSKAIFYRSISPRHFRNGDWNTGGTCDTIRFEEGKPAQESTAVDANAESAVKGTTVKLLNITALSMARGETHVSKYGRNKGGQDCLHWCLPGIPDTWNEILLANLAASRTT